MKESTRQQLMVVSTAWRFFFSGVLVGAGAFAVWAEFSGMIADDIRLTFVFMLLLPVLLLFAQVPALILQIGDGVSKMRHSKQDGSQNQPSHRTADSRADAAISGR
jgi:hypothetical protein